MPNLVLEKSFNNQEIPKHFYVSIIFDPIDHKNKIIELSRGKLNGVKGISSSPHAATDFLDERKALLAMDGEEVVELNKISKVMYSNPDYLVSNRFKAWIRIFDWNLTPEDALSRAVSDFVFIIHKQIKGLMEEHEISLPEHFESKIEKVIIDNIDKVNSTNSLAVIIYSMYIKPEFSTKKKTYIFKKIMEIVRTKIQYYIKSFATEKEWLIKDQNLVVPSKSTLIIPIGISKSVYDAWKNKNLTLKQSNDNIKSILELELTLKIIKEHGLDTKYKISIMNNDKFRHYSKTMVNNKH